MRIIFTKELGPLLFWVMFSSLFIFSGCSDDDTVAETDFTALSAKITEAENLIATTEEGTAEGQYVRGSKAILQEAIDLAIVIRDTETSLQPAVDNTVIAVQAAMDVYGSSVIEAIDPDNLVGHWPFSAGTGTTAADYSGNDFDGTFQTGHADMGAGTATWTTDRYGNENSAVSFDKGGWIEVPYNSALNPAQMTVSVWVNVREIDANNRFLGLQSWLGYKFQLQDANKPFFTAAVTPAHTGTIYDQDAATEIAIEEWIHIAVSFGGGEMVFYIDGDEARRVPELAGDLATITDHSLAIGVGSSRYADTDANYGDEAHADYHIIPAAWGGYFRGSLDELRIYKSVLSPTQIQSIYTLEKP